MTRPRRSRDTASEDQLIEPYAVRKKRLAAEKARWAALNPLERMTLVYTGDDECRYDDDVLKAHKEHPQYTIWQFQQFKCGHRGGMQLPQIGKYLGIHTSTMKNFRRWLDLPKRSGQNTLVDEKTRNLSVRFTPTMLAAATVRAHSQHMTFPVYLRRLIEADLAKGSDPP